MIRGLITTPLLLAALGFGALYYAYGEVDPCRVLALEEARRGIAPESWHRLGVSQMSTGECVRGLADSWWERVGEAFD